jgi:hypothetical protein
LGPTVDCCNGRNLTGVSSFTSFALFPKLPAELRVQIWEVPIPRPKIRRFSPQDFSLSGGNKTVYYRPLFQHEDSENCTPVLRACKESREVALRLLPAKLPSVKKQLEIHFNPQDVIFIYIRHRLHLERRGGTGWKSLIFDWWYFGKEVEILAVRDYGVKWDMMVTFFSSPKLRYLILVGITPTSCELTAMDYSVLFRKYWTQDYDARFYFIDQKILESRDLTFLEGEYHMVWNKSETPSFTSPYFSSSAITNRIMLQYG